MSSTQILPGQTTPRLPATTVNQKLEVIILPVSDVDRAKRFYERLKWRLDADFAADGWHVVQLTPPGSACSVMFGEGFTTAPPGSAQGTFLVVDDLEAARAELVANGVDVSEPFHFDGGRLRAAGTTDRVPGADPERRSYFSFLSFADPDGNSWLVQEVKARLPGRGFSSLDVTTMVELLREAEEGHGAYEPAAPKHHWSEWYAAYMVARTQGRSREEAADDGARRVEGRADIVRV